MRIIQTLDTNQIQLDPEYILVYTFYVDKKQFLQAKNDFTGISQPFLLQI